MALKDFLVTQPFASDINFIAERDSGVTGNFEIKIIETGELIHSKKRGANLPKTNRDMHEIAVRIEEAFENM